MEKGVINMGKANKEVTTAFGIPNRACKYYLDTLVCGDDDKFHTCCLEECQLSGLLFGFHSMNVHHVFDESGVCIHCGDVEPPNTEE